ncbi:hypothetical protein [Winogradskyella aurantiaca]|uniref:hypothetical protein n=1 Tax=Winogradskyella aurantiaca TaxID=2219558 RepID=UPI001300790B|nr:hypothetical protein [Winogradskyella aurantiaca]
MGLFSKKLELSTSDFTKINSILPAELQKSSYQVEDFKSERMHVRLETLIETLDKQLSSAIKNIAAYKKKSSDITESKMLLFNTDIREAELLGFVDHGEIVKFTTASSGNRYENGVIGAAIEGSLDKIWRESGSQYDGIQRAKATLLKKAKALYPKCTAVYNFELDMQAMGSTGDVFVYVRGMACEKENKAMSLIKTQTENQAKTLEENKDSLKAKLLMLQKSRSDIPKSVKQLEEFLYNN